MARSVRGPEMIEAVVARLEVLAFSSVLPACLAGALVMAAGFALLGAPVYSAAGLAFAGTLVVYNVDRLRDLERDRRSSPRRSAFVGQHGSLLVGLVVLGSAAAAVLGWQIGPPAAAPCAVALLPALFHRRIKRHPGVKALYVTAAWVTVAVGLPGMLALAGTPPDVLAGEDSRQVGEVGRRIALIAFIYTTAIGANLIAANVREDREGSGARRAIWRARGLAAIGILIACTAPAPLVALGWIPLAQLASLMVFRIDERTRLIALDGCLLLGTLAALTHGSLL